MENNTALPQAIGIIMDGNRRYAKTKGISSLEGHRRGYEKLRELISWAKEIGIPYLTVYAFSTENWKRSTEEVGYLMQLFSSVIQDMGSDAKKNNTRLVFIGETHHLREDIVRAMRQVEVDTNECNALTLTIALSYGGRQEIIDAIRRIPEADRITLSEEVFANYLWTTNTPDPDIIIRTGGEQRLSNFLTWQSVYSEFFFTTTFWPDFSKQEFLSIVNDFAMRERRIGV